MSELRVSDGTTIFTYLIGEIEDGTFSLGQEERSGTIEMQEVAMAVHGTFLGKDSFFDLPDDGEGYRAELAVPFGRVNGIIKRSQIRQDPVAKTWAVTIISGAADTFLRRIEDISADPGLFFLGLSVDVKEIATDTGSVSDKVWTWFDIRLLFITTVALGTDMVVQFQPLRGIGFTMDVDYLDGAVEKTIERVTAVYVSDPDSIHPSLSFLPDWSGRDLFDVCQRMLGWRISGEYAAFPSTTIVVTILTDRWTENSGAVLDNLETEDGYEIGYQQKDVPDFAIQYKNGTMEDFLHASAERNDQDAVYAAETTRLDGEGQGLNDGLEQIGFTLPQIWTPDITTQVDFVPQSGPHPNYKEDVTYSAPVVSASGTIYFASFHLNVDFFYLIRRQPKDPQPTQRAVVGDHFATNLIENFQLRRTSFFLLEGSFDYERIVPKPTVGDPVGGVRFAGKSYMVKRELRDMIRGVSDYLLTFPDPAVLEAIQTEPLPVSPPVNLTACFVIIDAFTADFHVDWEAPVNGAQGPPTSYEVERQQPGFPWTNVANPVVTVYVDLGVARLVPTEYRVRSVNGFGKSTWVFVIASDECVF